MDDCVTCGGFHLVGGNQIRPIAQRGIRGGLRAAPVQSGAYEGPVGRLLGSLATQAPAGGPAISMGPDPYSSPVYAALATRNRGVVGLGAVDTSQASDVPDAPAPSPPSADESRFSDWDKFKLVGLGVMTLAVVGGVFLIRNVLKK